MLVIEVIKLVLAGLFKITLELELNSFGFYGNNEKELLK